MVDHTLIRGGLVLDVDAGNADARDVLVTGERIESIGAPGMEAPEEATLVDASGCLLIPGLVNAHTHGHGSLAKGAGDRWSLELLLNAGPAIGGNRTLEDKYLSAKLNAAEMLLKGCTAAYDLYFEFPVPTPEGMAAVAHGYAEAGVRAVLAPMMADHSFYEAVPGLLDALPDAARRDAERLRLRPHEESVRACRALLDDWPADRAKIAPALAPTIPLHCSDEFMLACARLADEHDVGLHMHLGESRAQSVAGLRRYGETLTAHLERIGVLGPRFTGAHCVWLDGDDLARLAAHGCRVAHNPGSNLRLGSGIAPAREMLRREVPVGVGTDGSNCSDNQNVFAAARLAAFVSRVTGSDVGEWISAPEALRMATTGAADVLGCGEKIGRLVPGYLADVVFLDLASINFVPLNDVVNQIVYSEDGTSVRDVMVGGRLVVRGRTLVSTDYAGLRADVAEAADRLRAANAQSWRIVRGLEDLVGRYCVGLARQEYHVQRTLAD